MMQRMFTFAFMFSPDVLLTLLIFQQNEHKWGKLIIILLCLKYRAVLRQKNDSNTKVFCETKRKL